MIQPEYQIRQFDDMLYPLDMRRSDVVSYEDAQVSAPVYATSVQPVYTATATQTEPYGAGKITREVWYNVTGNELKPEVFNYSPNEATELSVFESPLNIADNYQQRIRGLVTAPQTGNYTFWLASDDEGELWLGAGATPATRRKIAEIKKYSVENNMFDVIPSQKSAQVYLQAGQQYYIEAIMKENTGGDNLSVGWQLPNGVMERPIPGKRLSPVPVPIQTSPVSAPASPTVMPPVAPVSQINTSCNTVQCLTDKLVKDALNVSPDDIRYITDPNKVYAPQGDSATQQAATPTTSALTPTSNTPKQAGGGSMMWIGLLLGGYALMKMASGGKPSKGGNLSGVPKKKKQTGSKPKTTGKRKATGRRKIVL